MVDCKCKACSRPLKAKDSIEIGYGPVCAEKAGVKKERFKKVESMNILDFCKEGDNIGTK